MFTVSESKTLFFKFLCGILRFTIKAQGSDPVDVSSISVYADKGLSGVFTVSGDAAVVKGNDGVVFKCSEPVKLREISGTDFNIVLPQGDYSALKVRICNSEGKEINLVSEDMLSVKRSGVTRVALSLAKSTFDTALEMIPVTDAEVDFTER